MFKTILLPFDGSELAQHALPYATDFARAAHGKLILMYALAPWELAIDAPARLHATATELQATGMDVITHIVPTHAGNLGQAILTTVQETDVDLVVMGTHAYGAVGRALFGSVTDEVVRHATVPVLVCTSQAERHWPEGRPRRILVPLDGSALAETALLQARQIARQFGASLDLVGVVDQTMVAVFDQGVQVGAYLDLLLAETRSYLERMASELRNDAVVVDVQAQLGVPDDIIRRLAGELDSDVIIMATHGRSGVGRVLLGSVALRVLQHSHLPVLLVQPAAVAAERRAEADKRSKKAAGEPLSLTVTETEGVLLRRALTMLHDAPGSDEQLRRAVAQLLSRLAGPVA